MLAWVIIAAGAAIGANLRYELTLWATQQFGVSFPFGTFAINGLGSLLIGVVLGVATTRAPISEPLRLLVVTGLLGGFTTFSSFSWEAYTLAMAGRWALAAAYLLGSVALGLLAVAAGAGAVRLLP